MEDHDQPTSSATAGQVRWHAIPFARRLNAEHAEARSDRRSMYSGLSLPVVLPAAILLALVTLVVTAYYVNHPQPEVDPDTIGYLSAAQHIHDYGQFVDILRTPGYPVFLAIVFTVAGRGNLDAVSIAQAGLFICAAIEIYALTYLITQRASAGFIVGGIVGSNTYLLTWVKPIIVEGFALWLTVTLVLLVVLFIRYPTPLRLWLVALTTLALFMTRPEWIYVPVPLFAYLLFVAARQKKTLQLLPHALIAIVALYGVLGLYVYANATQNGYAGVTVVQPVNLLGKIMQYHLQSGAAPQYTDIAGKIDSFVASGGWDPWVFLHQNPALQSQHYSRVGSFAVSAIEHQPLAFAMRTIRFMLASPNHYWAWAKISSAGHFSRPLFLLQSVSALVHRLLFLIFPCVALWGVLMCVPRTSRRPGVEAMAGVMLLAAYDLVVTSVASYHPLDLARIQTSLDPLLMVGVFGTIPALLTLLRVHTAPAPSRTVPQPLTPLTLSLLIPAYNERSTIGEVLRQVQQLPYEKEIIVIDDCSTDGTRELLQQTEWPTDVRVLFHDRNLGKGAAIRTGIRAATKSVVVIQDADLEYNPDDLPLLLRPIQDGVADVVYGSRFLGIHRSFMLHHYVGNKLLTLITNVLFGNMLTDMETGYKAFRTPIIKDIRIRSNRFDFEPEITAKVLKRGYRIYEVPIYYAGRDYAEGKKITWRDGIWAIWALVKFRLIE